MYFFVALPQEIYVLTDQFFSLKVLFNPVPYVIFASQFCTSQQLVLEQTHSPVGGIFIKVGDLISAPCVWYRKSIYTPHLP